MQPLVFPFKKKKKKYRSVIEAAAIAVLEHPYCNDISCIFSILQLPQHPAVHHYMYVLHLFHSLRPLILGFLVISMCSAYFASSSKMSDYLFEIIFCNFLTMLMAIFGIHDF